MILPVLALFALAILAIIYINRPQCVQQGDDCTSSPVGCCNGLYCNEATEKCEYNYIKNESKDCGTLRDDKGTIFLTSDATNKTKEEFIKSIVNECDKCRNNPDACPPRSYIKRCKGFMIVDDPTGMASDHWQKGVAPLCDTDQISTLITAKKGVDTYTIVQ